MNSIPEDEIVVTLQAALPNLLAVYAFGSRVQGTAGPDSDLDLAVLVAGKVPPLQTWDLAQTLAIRFDHDVDLLDLRDASTVMQYQVITTGKRPLPLPSRPACQPDVNVYQQLTAVMLSPVRRSIPIQHRYPFPGPRGLKLQTTPFRRRSL